MMLPTNSLKFICLVVGLAHASNGRPPILSVGFEARSYGPLPLNTPLMDSKPRSILNLNHPKADSADRTEQSKRTPKLRWKDQQQPEQTSSELMADLESMPIIPSVTAKKPAYPASAPLEFGPAPTYLGNRKWKYKIGNYMSEIRYGPPPAYMNPTLEPETATLPCPEPNVTDPEESDSSDEWKRRFDEMMAADASEIMAAEKPETPASAPARSTRPHPLKVGLTATYRGDDENGEGVYTMKTGPYCSVRVPKPRENGESDESPKPRQAKPGKVSRQNCQNRESDESPCSSDSMTFNIEFCEDVRDPTKFYVGSKVQIFRSSGRWSDGTITEFETAVNGTRYAKVEFKALAPNGELQTAWKRAPVNDPNLMRLVVHNRRLMNLPKTHRVLEALLEDINVSTQ